MQEFTTETPYRFFAAANGTNGFRSYFDDIFLSEKFEKIYVLKGGPGTGKSTLLRELASAFTGQGIMTEIFFCSSDPTSLDAVLFSRGKRQIAILDGTAPHERDARIPGATDTLVNLGIGFDEECLRKQKREILDLQKKKSLAYKEAYFYLGLFGLFESKIEAEYKSRIKKEVIKDWIEKEFPLSGKEIMHGAFSPRLIRAFSRDGVKRLDSYEKISEKSIVFEGDEILSGILLSEIFSTLKERGCGGYYAPSPFADSLTDGILSGDLKISITARREKGEGALPCEDFLSPIEEELASVLQAYRTEANRYLALARDALMRASEQHFALEKIYTPAMHFERLRPLKETLKNQIAALLA